MCAATVTRPEDHAALASGAAQVNQAQARAAHLTPETIAFVTDLAERFGSTPIIATSVADAHDQLVLSRAIISAQAAIAAGDRRAARIGLQRAQDALARIAEHSPAGEGRDANEVARWVAEAFGDVSRQRIANVIGVDRRTLTRWVSDTGTRPADEDARRLRTFARTTALLLRALTAAGAMRWFELPNAELGGRTPAQRLADHDAAPQLERAAYALLGGDAS